MKKNLVFVIIIFVAAGIVYFSFFWPLNKSDDLRGTIGGVEKAEKYRGEQLDDSDLLMENEDFIALIQSAQWQNAMKNEDIVTFLESDDFKSFVSLTADMQRLFVLSKCFQKFYSQLEQEPDPTPDAAMAILKSDEFQKQISAQDFLGPMPSTPLAQDFQQWVVLLNTDIVKKLIFSNDLNLVEYNVALQNFYKNADFQSLFSSDMQKLINSQEFENYVYSDDFQNTIFYSQDFQKFGFLSQDFQKAIFALGQDFQALMQSGLSMHILWNNQDFQKLVFSQDFQQAILTNNQDFQKLVNSQDFQKYIRD